MRRLTMGGLVVMMAVTTGELRAAEPVKITDPKDGEIVARFLEHVAKVPGEISPEHCRKMAADECEGYTWKILPFLDMPLTAYQVTGDAKWLDTFVQTFANMRSAMIKGPDGYLGWYGKALSTFQDPTDPGKKVDVIINSFRTTNLLAEFVEAIDRDPELRKKYERQQAEYRALMEDHLVKKWDARGNYVDLGSGGAIYRTHAGLKEDKAHLTQPHNKHSIIIRALLALYRVTGNDEYARKAVKLGTRYKRCLKLEDGHYEWHYWDPAGAWDVLPSDKARWKHWIGVEHKGGYYSSSLTQAVELYHHGLVFDRKDIDRFLKTQLTQAWNASLEDPKWARCDGTTSAKYMQGAYMCSALAPFSEKIHAFVYTGPRQDERRKNAAHPWQGGPVANGWIGGKLVYCPAAAGGKQMRADAGERFLSKSDNREFVKSLAFEVTGSGYSAPMSPAQMKPMPPEPAAK